MSAKRVVIAGGSGFVGVSLSHHLASAGWNVVLLSRHAPRVPGPWQHVTWDARSVGEWASELEGADGLVNLTGRSVDCIKMPDHCDEILRSRVESTTVPGQALKSISSPPPVWVQMSTAHIYGDPPQVVCTDESPSGLGLAPYVGRAWEQAYGTAVLPSQRQVVLRTSFVIGRDRGAGGGALARLGLLAKLGLGGTVGSGQQGMSSKMHSVRRDEHCFVWDCFPPPTHPFLSTPWSAVSCSRTVLGWAINRPTCGLVCSPPACC